MVETTHSESSGTGAVRDPPTCPILTSSGDVYQVCNSKDCAWWVHDSCACALVVVAESLFRLSRRGTASVRLLSVEDVMARQRGKN